MGGLRNRIAAGVLTLLGLAATQVRADDAIEKFYHNRTVTLVVGTAPGGGYDITARMLAPFLTKYIPGNPAVVINNMPGAAGVRSTGYMASVAERDGSVIGILQNFSIMEPIVGNPAAKYDPREFEWLGSPAPETGVLMMWHGSKGTTLESLREKEALIGVEAIASTASFMARVLNDTIGLKLKLVPGYAGSAPILVAMESGEVDGFVNFYSSLMQSRPTWIAEKKTIIPVQLGDAPEKTLGATPFLTDIAQGAEKKAIARAAAVPLALGRPLVAPSGTPPDRLAALRAAMMKAFADPEFVAQAKTLGYADLKPKTSEELSRSIHALYGERPEVLERIKTIYNAPN